MISINKDKTITIAGFEEGVETARIGKHRFRKGIRY